MDAEKRERTEPRSWTGQTIARLYLGVAGLIVVVVLRALSGTSSADTRRFDVIVVLVISGFVILASLIRLWVKLARAEAGYNEEFGLSDIWSGPAYHAGRAAQKRRQTGTTACPYCGGSVKQTAEWCKLCLSRPVENPVFNRRR